MNNLPFYFHIPGLCKSDQSKIFALESVRGCDESRCLTLEGLGGIYIVGNLYKFQCTAFLADDKIHLPVFRTGFVIINIQELVRTLSQQLYVNDILQPIFSAAMEFSRLFCRPGSTMYDFVFLILSMLLKECLFRTCTRKACCR